MIPYIGEASLHLRKKLKRIFKRLNCDIQIVFKTEKVKKYFGLKARTPKWMKSCIVYKYKCQVDPESLYIGKSKRRLHQRVSEHQKTNTAITNHIEHCDDCRNNFFNNFEIEYIGRSEFEINVVEALKILEQNPKLNKQIANNGNAYFLKIFN